MKKAENWVPLKPQKSNLHSQLFGKIEWDPKFIAHAGDLEINVGTLNQLLNQLQINFHIEIVSVAGKRKRSSPQVYSTSPNGEASTTLISQNKIAKPQNWMLQNIDGHWKLLIPFSNIRDYLVEQDPNQSHDQFLTKYASYIELQLKQTIPWLIVNNIIHLEDKNIAIETLVDIVAHVLTLLAIFYDATKYLTQNPVLFIERAIAFQLMRQLVLPASFAFALAVSYVTAKTSQFDQNENSALNQQFSYLMSKKDFPFKYLFPLKSMRFFTIPMILALTNTAQFIRPIASAPRSSSQTSRAQ